MESVEGHGSDAINALPCSDTARAQSSLIRESRYLRYLASLPDKSSLPCPGCEAIFFFSWSRAIISLIMGSWESLSGDEAPLPRDLPLELSQELDDEKAATDGTCSSDMMTARAETRKKLFLQLPAARDSKEIISGFTEVSTV